MFRCFQALGAALRTRVRWTVVFVSLWGAWMPLLSEGQTLTLSNGVQKYVGLTNTTVTMTGRCELWLTDPNTPLSGCTVNLNSADAYLILPNITASVAAASLLGQVRVNGSSAVADSNVRVVQYSMGAVIIPQPPDFQPLQVFEGPNFTGAALSLSQYVYYQGGGLGALNAKISSFRLKRGYLATFAQNQDGTGLSKCYVAQDADLEAGVLTNSLDNNVRFIYVTPWRWTSKKGVSGDPGIGLLNLRWWYNWNISSSSARDLEYVAIRQNQYWPGLGQNWQALGINTVLGYNEPDNSSQANMSVATALGAWPDLLGTGLRIGSPAVTDGGRSSWLYPFIQQADAAGLRVDFIAVHYYWAWNPADPNGAANLMYSFLLDIWNNTHRPIWITEWNNGANWTDNNPYPPPTYAQQQACIAAMIAMLDSTPFVERYALYNWVEDVRSVVTNGVPTPAGIAYSNQVSPLSYIQQIPNPGTRSFAQYLFTTNTLDSSGYGNNGLAFGSPGYVSGHSGQALAVALDGANSFIQLTPNIANSTNFTFAAWVYWKGGANWQRIFDFGNDTSHYLFLTPGSGSGTLRFAINNGAGEQIIESGALSSGSWQHVAVTLSGSTATLYLNGAPVASSSGFSLAPSAFSPANNYLGKSQFAADPLFNGNFDEVLITDNALTAGQIAALQTNQPPQAATANLFCGTAPQFQFFSTNLSGTITDPNPGSVLTYSKTAGPAWLTVSSSGTASGTPGAADWGTNYFTVLATDTAGQAAFTELSVYVPPIYANGIWSVDASGSWGDGSKWTNAVVANGPGTLADFSTLAIAADRTVTLDFSRSIGTLRFGAASGTHNWTLGAVAGSALTLDSGANTAPVIAVNQNTSTITVPLSGTNGVTKTGAGTLVLNANNSLLTGFTRISAGTLKLASGYGLAGSTLYLDPSDAGVLSFGTLGAVALGGLGGSQNLVLTNASGGAVALTVGANSQNGAYAGVLSGPGGLTKAGSGLFTLSRSNTYAGATTVIGGTLRLSRDPIVKLTFDSGSASANGSIVTNTGTGGSALNGVIVGSSGLSFVSGKVGNALNLAGVGSYVSIPDRVTSLDGNTAGVDWTLALWLQTTQAGAGFAYQGDGGWVANNTAFYLNQGNTTAGTHAGAVRWGGGWLTGTANLNDGRWHFVAITSTNGTKNIYVDGNLDASNTSWNNASAGSQFWIGGTADSGDGVAKMNGQLDEVSIYNRALGLTEIRSLTNSQPGLTPGNFGGQLPATTALGFGSTATFDLDGNSQTLAGLFDVNSGTGQLTNSGPAPVTLTLAGNSGSRTFSGVIGDGSPANAISLVKNGAATQVLAGTNTYSGTTTVNAGTLLVNGALGPGTVTANATLGGNGTITGPVTIQSGATFAPGMGTGPLTISNSLTLAANSSTLMELTKDSGLTNDTVLGLSSVSYNGSLTVSNVGLTPLVAGDAFQLFAAQSYSGAFATVSLPALSPPLYWTNLLTANGVIAVASTVSTVPPSLVWSLSGTNLTLSWPSDHTSWRLLMQTNNLAGGISSNTNDWTAIPGASATNMIRVPLDSALPAEFFRLVLP